MICEGAPASWYNIERKFTTMGPAVGETVSETEEKERGGGDRRTTVIQIAFIPALWRQTLPLRALPAELL